jgi:hypothetical protein
MSGTPLSTTYLPTSGRRCWLEHWNAATYWPHCRNKTASEGDRPTSRIPRSVSVRPMCWQLFGAGFRELPRGALLATELGCGVSEKGDGQSGVPGLEGCERFFQCGSGGVSGSRWDGCDFSTPTGHQSHPDSGLHVQSHLLWSHQRQSIEEFSRRQHRF